jgi:putative transposase
MKFAFIAEVGVAFPVAVVCRVLDVSSSGYYAARKRPASGRAKADDELRARIKTAHIASKGRYGSPRLHADFREGGERIGRKRIARLMREEGIRGRARRRFRSTTDSKHAFPIAANLLARDFTAVAPDTVWVTDITAIPTREGWVYLAAILDLFSRRVVGWAMSECVDRHLALAALAIAVRNRRPPPGLVHHSDRGSTYASNDYRAALREDGIRCSMSRKGDCWDNAVAESFFATLKREIEDADRFETRSQATAAIRDYIDRFYNVQRRHSTIGYKSPIEFELMNRMRENAP